MRILCQHSPPEPPFAIIPLGSLKFAIVDPDDFDEINKHRWFAKKSASRYYAVRKVTSRGKTRLVRMHRQIAHTISSFVCHHHNGNPLDNRKKNLENMRRGLHDMIHWKAGKKWR